MITELIAGKSAREDIERILRDIHSKGPIDPALLERLAYYKKFHNEILSEFEGILINVMGLFYKTPQKTLNMLGEVYSIFSQSIENEYGISFTPVQASAYKHIREERYFSFSAPTSAGKSFLFRNIIKNVRGDMVIVVPSRALIAEYYQEVISSVDKSTLVLQFIDNINMNKLRNRVFIITPERGVELFKMITDFNIEIFLFDEAQISEEDIRGMKFDAFVRRVDRFLPKAKKVFAHPFVINPEAQLKKHHFDCDAFAYNYRQQSVGKIFMIHDDGEFSFFSPHEGDEVVRYGKDIVEEILRMNGTLLAYVSKKIIYTEEILEKFSKYIALCEQVEDRDALLIINKLKDFIGASDSDHNSLMIKLMERGIVIHHGSMPLRARLFVEEFIRKGFAKICFSTSTLVQGINMPFNIVWIHSFYMIKDLTLKNLIGRAGRTSSSNKSFDYGYTIVERENVATFKKRYNEEFSLSNESPLDTEIGEIDEDLRDIAEAVVSDTFNDELNLPKSQLDRIEAAKIFPSIQYVLNALFLEDRVLSGHEYYELDDATRKKVKNAFQEIFCSHLRRENLTKAEKSVLSAAIPILLWQVQSTSFSQIVSLRHSFISNKKERSALRGAFSNGKIDSKELRVRLKKLKARYSPIASPIPNRKLTRAGLFEKGVSVLDISYDVIVYDTYDYLDKVISISMADPLCAALKLYYDNTADARALTLINYIKFGTDDQLNIWLLRYGFSFEDLNWLHDIVEKVDSGQIYFKDNIFELNSEKYSLIERYL